MSDSKTQPAVQWWLVRLGPHGNPTLSDGPHDGGIAGFLKAHEYGGSDGSYALQVDAPEKAS